jgi:hypothetical protein
MILTNNRYLRKPGDSDILDKLACVTVDVERLDSTDFAGVNQDVKSILDIITGTWPSTFFVTGEVAENCPDVVKGIVEAGHEVACHGMWHERFDTLTKAEQLQRIDRATRQIAESSGERPSGFRAPQHRANAFTLQVLEELDYLYDSSVLPRTPFMRPESHKKVRFLRAPNQPYYPSRNDIAKRGDCNVLELPCSTYFLPFVSSLTLKSKFASTMLGKILTRRDRPIIYYLHSYDSTVTKGKLDWLTELIASLGRKRKIVRMLDLAKMYRDLHPSKPEALLPA